MAQGKPVITTRVGQIARLVQPGENGVFFDPEKPEDLFEKTSSLVNNSKLRVHVGRNARNTILENHTWDHKAAQLAQLCNKVIKRSYISNDSIR